MERDAFLSVGLISMVKAKGKREFHKLIVILGLQRLSYPCEGHGKVISKLGFIHLELDQLI